MVLQLPFMTSCHALESHETQQDAQDLGPTVLRDEENLKIIHPGHGARCHRTTLMAYRHSDLQSATVWKQIACLDICVFDYPKRHHSRNCVVRSFWEQCAICTHEVWNSIWPICMFLKMKTAWVSCPCWHMLRSCQPLAYKNHGMFIHLG